MDLNALAKAHPAHWSKATAIRALTLDAVAAANSGHSGMPMGMADVATVLFEKHLKFDASNPLWPDRDRFILSAGHGSMLIYSLLHLTGYEQFPLEEIKNFRQMGARTAGHPENFLADAIETTTGPLGQGIANSVGFAMAEEIQRAQYGKKIVDHFTYVIAGDGCLMEGISHEAIALAGRHKLSKLIVMWDNNDITIDGPVSLSDKVDQVARFKAADWHVIEIDGHNPDEIDAALTEARKSDLPTMIACKTHIALGHAAQDTSKGHGALTDADQMAAAKAAYADADRRAIVSREHRAAGNIQAAAAATAALRLDEDTGTLIAGGLDQIVDVGAGLPHGHVDHVSLTAAATEAADANAKGGTVAFEREVEGAGDIHAAGTTATGLRLSKETGGFQAKGRDRATEVTVDPARQTA